jgi:hypothetical protein
MIKTHSIPLNIFPIVKKLSWAGFKTKPIPFMDVLKAKKCPSLIIISLITSMSFMISILSGSKHRKTTSNLKTCYF